MSTIQSTAEKSRNVRNRATKRSPLLKDQWLTETIISANALITRLGRLIRNLLESGNHRVADGVRVPAFTAVLFEVFRHGLT